MTTPRPGAGEHEGGAARAVPVVDPLAPTRPADARVAKRITSFTRRGRRLSDRLEEAMARHGADYVVDPPRAAGETTVDPAWRLDVDALFGRRAPLVVEIGCGHGDQVVAHAAAHPDVDHLALEVWDPGVARTVEHAAREGVRNLRVLPADAALALATALPGGRASEVWTFFPDPWRKNRHHKRRLVQVAFAPVVARVLADGGHWRMATDWADYAEHMRAVLRRTPYFVPDPADGEPSWADADVWSPRYAQRVRTHFEQRGERAGRPVWDLAAVRVPRAQQPDAAHLPGADAR